MRIQKIKDEELEPLKIASLPNRPTAPEEYGGVGYSAKDMKGAFDRLPLFLAGKFNELLEDIEAEGEDSIAYAIKIGLGESISLRDFIDWFSTGQILAFIPTGEESLAAFLTALRRDVDKCLNALEEKK